MSRRRLSEDERTLWLGVARSIAPLRRHQRPGPEPPPPPVPPPSNAKPKKPAASARPKPIIPAPPPLAPLDRRMKRRLARGAETIDARLDLHGLTQAEAHGALAGFVRSAQARGCRLVLVITGKGAGDPYSERGVLKRQVPMWLRLPDLRSMIVGFETASAAHGGEGALYVRLRRKQGID